MLMLVCSALVIKAARATLILIPLLGLHYLLTPLRPERGTEGEQVYEYITAVSLSIQVSLVIVHCMLLNF